MHRVFAFVALALATAGCFSPIGTARTLAPGALQVHAGAGALSVVDEGRCGADDLCLDETPLVPTAAFGLRAGVADGLELGLGLQPLGPSVDLKVALARTRDFALALDPSATVGISRAAASGLIASLPLLVDLELGDGVTLVGSITPSRAFVRESADPPPFLGLGAGLLLRVTDDIAIQPGVGWLAPFDGSEELSFLTFGLGFVFGRGPTAADAVPPPPRR
jgi:hypothetical protein